MHSLLDDGQKGKEFPFRPQTMLAPMEGLTNTAVRNAVASRTGLGVVCTEFIRISKTPLSRKALRKEFHRPPNTPLSVQLMGNDASLMAESAQVLAAAGADIIDINLGCPTAKALKGNVGAAMLRDLNLLEEVLKAMREKIPGLMSAKIRAGFETADKSLEIAKRVEDTGVDFITVHPRSRQDQYKGRADWRIIKIIAENTSIPVVGNGDILYVEDAVNMRAQTGCEPIMIGRGALRNPWLFRQIEEHDNGSEIYRPDGAAVLSFFDDVFSSMSSHFNQNHDRLLSRYKEIIRMTLRSWLGSAEVLPKLLRSQSYKEFYSILEAEIGVAHFENFDYGFKAHEKRS